MGMLEDIFWNRDEQPCMFCNESCFTQVRKIWGMDAFSVSACNLCVQYVEGCVYRNASPNSQNEEVLVRGECYEPLRRGMWVPTLHALTRVMIRLERVEAQLGTTTLEMQRASLDEVDPAETWRQLVRNASKRLARDADGNDIKEEYGYPIAIVSLLLKMRRNMIDAFRNAAKALLGT